MNIIKYCRRTFSFFLTLVFAALLLTACGGGGGGGGGESSNTPSTNANTNWDQLVWDQDDWS